MKNHLELLISYTLYVLGLMDAISKTNFKRLRSPETESKEWIGARLYKIVVPVRQASLAGGIDSLESMPGLLKRLQIRALACGINI